jgi:hypothetical protein
MVFIALVASGLRVVVLPGSSSRPTAALFPPGMRYLLAKYESRHQRGAGALPLQVELSQGNLRLDLLGYLLSCALTRADPLGFALALVIDKDPPGTFVLPDFDGPMPVLLLFRLSLQFCVICVSAGEK